MFSALQTASSMSRLGPETITWKASHDISFPYQTSASRSWIRSSIPASSSWVRSLRHVRLRSLEEGLESSGKVLIHCISGINRSPSIAMAFLMKRNSWTFEQAWGHVKGRFDHWWKACIDVFRRKQISPHISYIGQLIAYEEHLFGTSGFERPNPKLFAYVSSLNMLQRKKIKAVEVAPDVTTSTKL